MHSEQKEEKMSGMAGVVERNIRALQERGRQQDVAKTFQEKIADSITRFTGSMRFVYIHVCLFGIWIVWNLGLLGLKPFDSSFVVLAMFASVEAIFLSTFVLISQNRSMALADKRAELDLQVSLLAEHEITRLITMITAIAKKMDIDDADNPELKELANDVHPEKVMDKIESNKYNEDTPDTIEK